MKSNQDEADTRLVLYALDALDSSSSVVIRSVDTDVLVIAAHHFPQIMEKYPGKVIIMDIGTGTNRRYISLSNLHSHMPTRVYVNLLQLHALTGCDSTSELFHISKRRGIHTLEAGDFKLSALGRVDINELTEEVQIECERFIANLYGQYNGYDGGTV